MGAEVLESRLLLNGDPIDLGALTGLERIEDFVGSFNTDDLYSFELAASDTVAVSLSASGDAVELQLALDANGNHMLDTGEALLTLTTSGIAPVAAARLLAAGSYLAEVSVGDTEDNSGYALVLDADQAAPQLPGAEPGNSLTAALDLGPLASAAAFAGSVGGAADPTDHYKFSVERDQSVSFRLGGVSVSTYLEVVANRDGNATVSPAEIIASGVASSSLDSLQVEDLTAGEYYLRVRPISASNMTDYTLHIEPGEALPSSAPADPGDVPAAAWNMGTLAESRSITETVGGLDSLDLYRFNVDSNTRVRVLLGGQRDYLTFQLYGDFDNSGILGSADEIHFAQTNLRDDVWFEQDLTAGTYYVSVAPQSSTYNSAYRLELSQTALPADPLGDPGNSPVSARDIGELTTPWTTEETVSGYDTFDVYRFTVDGNSQVRLWGWAESDSVTFQLAADFDNNGTIGSSEVLEGFNLSGGTQSWFEQDLTAGTYYALVSRYFNNQNSSAYHLELSRTSLPADPLGDPGNTLATAREFGELTGIWSAEEVVSGHDVSDYYRFTVEGNSRVRLLSHAISENVSFELSADQDQNGTISSAEILYDFNQSGRTQSFVEQDLSAGSYYLRVTRYINHQYNSAYSLELSRADLPADPLGDPGDTLASARQLGELDSPWSVDEVVGGHDRWDIYRFEVDANARVRLLAEAMSETTTFDLAGDFNDDGTIASSEILGSFTPSPGSQSWFEQDLTPGVYYARVERYVNETFNSAYHLELTRTDLPADPAGDPGAELATARDIGQLPAEWTVEEVVSGHDPADLYQFTVESNALLGLYLDPRSERTTIELFGDLDGDGVLESFESLVSAEFNIGENLLEHVVTPGAYFVRVSRFFRDEFNSAYRLRLARTDLPGAPLGDPGESQAEATDIGTLDSQQMFHDAVGGHDAADFYRFTLAQSETVRIAVTGVTESTQFRLLTAPDGNQLFSTQSWSAATLRLEESLGAGSYYISLSPLTGSNASAYGLALQVDEIPALTPPDPGSTMATAWDMGVIGTGQRFLGSLAPTDTLDFYRFTLEQHAAIEAQLDQLTADADIYLIADLDSDGLWDTSDTLESHNTVGVTSSFVAEDLAAGDYYILAQRGSSGSNASYRLTLTMEPILTDPPADPGDTFATAFDLGTLVAGLDRTASQVVGAWDADDMYRFELTEPSRLQVRQSLGSEQMKVSLIADRDGDGVWYNNETLEEDVSFANNHAFAEELEAGVYYVSVRRFYAAQYNSAYRLSLRAEPIVTDPLADPGESFATAHDLGSVASGVELVASQLIGATDPADFYRIELTETSRLHVWQSHANEPTSLYLIADYDGDGVWNNSETLESSTTLCICVNLMASDLVPGVYYVSVQQHSSSPDTNTAYRLSLRTNAIKTGPPTDPGETLATAHDLGSLAPAMQIETHQLVGAGDLDDIYRFELTGPTRLQVWQTGASEQTKLYLGIDLNGNGIWEATESIETDQGFSTNHTLSEDLPAGVYFVSVRSYSENVAEYNSAYRLTLRTEPLETDPLADPGNSIGDALDIGTFAAGREFTARQLVGNTDFYDYYQFEVTDPIRLNVWQTDAVEEIGLYLYSDINGDGVGELLESDSSFSTNHSFGEDLIPGVYYVALRPYSSAGGYNSAYRLTMRAEALATDPQADPGNQLATAHNLGLLDSERILRQVLGNGDRDDYYAFTIDRLQTVQAWLYGLTEDVDLYLYADVDGNGSIGSGETLATSGRFGASDEFFREELAPGTYFLRTNSVIATDNTAYVLELQTDQFEFAAPAEGPAVASITPLGEPVIDTIDVAFTSEIDPASFTAADVVYTGQAGNLALESIEQLSAQTYRLHFAPPNSSGVYTLSIGPGITDTLGNPMNQDGDRFAGETVDDRYRTQLLIVATDLEIESVATVQSATTFGSSLTVEYEVRNAGVISLATPWTDRVWLSTNAALDAGDLLLGQFSSSDQLPLAASASYQRSETFDLPLVTSLPEGDYYVIVVADSAGVQPESSEMNNQAVSLPLSIAHPPLPDLTVTAITIPQEAYGQQQVSISWTLTNAGGADVLDPFVDRLYLSLDTELGNDILLGTYAFESSVPAGQSVTRTQLVSVPADYLGQFHLLVATDAFNNIYERLGEANNVSASPATLEVRQPLRPDLRVASVGTPSDAFSEQEVVVTWIVENNGNDATNAPIWYDRVYFSNDPQFNPQDDVLLGTVANTSYLAPGEQYANSLAVTVPRGIDGDYYFLVVTDATNRVTELDREGNNTQAGNPTDIHLTPPPDLVVSTVAAPTVGLSGQEIVVRWTIANQGPGDTRVDSWTDAVYLSSDDQYDAADRRLGTLVHHGGLDFGESYTAERSFVLPGDSGGPYHVLVLTDSQNAVYEHDREDNNTSDDPPPLSVTPVRADLEVTAVGADASARAGTSTTVSWRVENLGIGVTPAAQWVDRVYLSLDADFNPAQDTLLITRNHSGPLVPDEGYDATVEVVLPHALDDEYYLFVATDVTGVVLELDDGNNSRPGDSSLTIGSSPADLRPQIEQLPASVAAGSPFLLSWGVANQGSGDTITDRWTDAVYLSADETFGNADDRLLVRHNHLGLLPPSQVAAVGGLVVQMPLDVVPDDYYLFVVADSTDRVFEGAGEGNNVSLPTPLTISRATANLQVSQVTAPTTADSGTTIEVSWTVTNTGPAATEALYWHDAIYLSSPATPGAEYNLGSVQRNNVLAAGGSYMATASVQIPSNFAGEFELYVVTDAFNRVLEDPSEGDNQLSAPVSLAITYIDTPPAPLPGPQPAPDINFPPELEVISVTAPAEALGGQSIEVSWTVRNNSYTTEHWTWTDGVYLSTDQFLDSLHDLPLGYLSRPTADLVLGETYSRTANFPIPVGLSGHFYLFVRADAGRRIAEAIELNNDAYDGQSVAVSLLPPVDLVVGTLTVPATGTPGQNASISYRVDNLGAQAATGSWTDTLFLSRDAEWSIDDPELGSVQHQGGVAVGGFYTETLEAPLPGLLPGAYHVIVRSDIRNQIPEANEANNIAGSLERVVLDLQSLVLGVPTGDTLAEDQSAYYKVEVLGGETLQLTLDSSSTTAANELYLRFGEMPSRTEFDFAFHAAFEPDQRILIPVTRAGTYYILAYGEHVEEESAPYTIQAEVLDFSIESIDLTRGSRFGSATIVVSGAKLSPTTEVQLVSPSGAVRGAERVWWINESTLWATLDLQGLPVAQYDVRVAEGLEQDALDDAFQVTSGPLGSFEVTVETPTRLLPGQSGFATLRYRNLGETDIAAPVVIVDAVQAQLLSQDELAPTDNTVTLLAHNPDGPAGILPPGAEHTILIPFKPTITLGQVELRASNLGSDDTPLAWDTLEQPLRPAGIVDEAWGVVWNRFLQSVGTDAAGLQAKLSENATYLSQLGMYTYSLPRLIGFELSQADNALPPAQPLQVTDASALVPGLPLEFSRVARQTISGRYALGSMGRGWTHNWDYQATTDAMGNVLIWANGSVRRFTRLDDGLYQGAAGDHAELTLAEGIYHFREAGGLQYGFLASGQISFLRDANGNRIDAGYTGGRLTSLTHTSGADLLLEYDPAGRIQQLTDDVGRITTYHYDPSGEYLEQVTTPRGTTTYTYNNSTSAAQLHALRSATGPDGATRYWEYDSQGRLAEQSLNGSLQTTYSYNDVTLVSLTNAAGAIEHRYFDDAGALRQRRDPLGEISRYEYDTAGSLVAVKAPAGVTTTFEHDPRQNPLSQIDPLLNRTGFEFDPASDRLLAVRNPNDQQLSFTHDERGNLTAITYSDNSAERFEHNAAGQVTRWINRRGEGVTYTYDARGLLQLKRYDDATEYAYTYDSHGNLLTALGPAGLVTLHYQSDRLTLVEYPGNRWLAFTYDAAGRRASSVDQDGFAVNYRYDTLGRLAELTDGADQRIVLYAYDDVGRLARKDNGNGTYTTYDFDPAGQLTSLVNRRADDGVNSSFLYTYDRLGRQATVTTLAGTTSFTYDHAGQLRGVELPGGRTLEYFYDAHGNRLQTVDSGATTFYLTNGLDQYSQVGSANYTYDADGNLSQIDEGGSLTTFGYDTENRLISAATPTGSWSYEYDAMGNRFAAVTGGMRTEYLIDPACLINVVGEYSAGSSVQYVHGLGLASRVESGVAAYYDFDATGSTVGLSDMAGAYQNTYSYLPFGELLSSSELLDNPFRFGGQAGGITESLGLINLRERFLAPDLGRFLSTNPRGIAGGETNLYRFAANNPLSRRGSDSYSAALDACHCEAIAAPGSLERIGSQPSFPLAEDNSAETCAEAVDSWFWGQIIKDSFVLALAETSELADNAFTQIVAAFDPNEIVGPAGNGPERWVSALQPLDYTVRFDNDPLLATAPARRVAITVPLDDDLDPRSVRFGNFGFGDLIVEVAGNRGFHAARLDLRDTLGVYVDVVAGVNINPGSVLTGTVFWELTAIDPATGQAPLDPLVGFLPLNLDGSEGQGFTTFSVRPRSAAGSGTVVDAEARIVFDTNPPVDTPRTFNTVDAQTPISSVTEAADGPSENVYQITWAGADEPTGAGLQGFDVYLSDSGKPFELWMGDTTLGSSLFVADPAKSYAFYTVAADRAGNRELSPLEVDATIGLRNAVVGRHLFYNNSALDLGSDNEAIATDKTALRPGATASFANYSSYVGGINGVMIDIAGLPAEVTLDPATDFEFRVGNDDSPESWSLLGVEPVISVERGAGTLATDRVTLSWPDGTARGAWLRIRVRATANTGLPADDVFYFGNAPGDTGDSSADALINGSDFLAVRQNPANFLDPAGNDHRFDFDRDRLVNATDLAIVREYATTLGTSLRLISVPLSLAPEFAGKRPIDQVYLGDGTLLKSESEPQPLLASQPAEKGCQPSAVDQLLASFADASDAGPTSPGSVSHRWTTATGNTDQESQFDAALAQLIAEFELVGLVDETALGRLR